MSGHKFTAGPWLVSNENMDTMIAERRGKVVLYGEHCELHPIADFQCNTSCIPVEEQEANAKLAAAAPKLLEALQELLDDYTGLVNSGDCGNWNPEEDPGVIKARAAIREATA